MKHANLFEEDHSLAHHQILKHMEDTSLPYRPRCTNTPQQPANIITTISDPSVHTALAQKSRLDTQDTTFAMASNQLSTSLQTSKDFTHATNSNMTKPSEAEQEYLLSKGFPVFGRVSTAAGWHADSSSGSPGQLSQTEGSLSGAPYADSPFTVPDSDIPSSPVLFPGPLERAELRELESSEAAEVDGVLGTSSNRKRSREAMEGPNGAQDEAFMRRKVAKTSGATFSPDEVAPLPKTTSGKRKRPQSTAAEEEEQDDQNEPLFRKKIARTSTYIDPTTSEEATPKKIINLSGSESGSSPQPAEPLQESYLHRLPAELRNRIYRYVGLRGSRLDLRNLEEPALAVAIPDLKDEVLSFIFSENKFRVPVTSRFSVDYPPGQRPQTSKKVPEKDSLGDFNNGHFEPGVIGIAPDSWVMNINPRCMALKHISFRIMESGEVDGSHRHLCDYFVNIRMVDGKPSAFCRTTVAVSTVLKSRMNHMAYLATARAKKYTEAEGFEGFTWEQAQQIAASFVSVPDARSRYTRKNGKTTLNEDHADSEGVKAAQ